MGRAVPILEEPGLWNGGLPLFHRQRHSESLSVDFANVARPFIAGRVIGKGGLPIYDLRFTIYDLGDCRL